MLFRSQQIILVRRSRPREQRRQQRFVLREVIRFGLRATGFGFLVSYVSGICAAEDKRHTEILAEMFRGELRQRAMRFVFLFRDDRNEMRTLVGQEAELFAVEQIAAGDRRAPVFFDVLNDEICAGEEAAVRQSLHRHRPRR